MIPLQHYQWFFQHGHSPFPNKVGESGLDHHGILLLFFWRCLLSVRYFTWLAPCSSRPRDANILYYSDWLTPGTMAVSLLLDTHSFLFNIMVTSAIRRTRHPYSLTYTLAENRRSRNSFPSPQAYQLHCFKVHLVASHL